MDKFNQKGIIQAVLVVIVVIAAAAALGTGIYLNKLTANLDSAGNSQEDQNKTFTNDLPVISNQYTSAPAPTFTPKPTPTPVPAVKPAATPIVAAKVDKCPKVETLACFSTSPICKKFPSPCEVPANWRIAGNN